MKPEIITLVVVLACTLLPLSVLIARGSSVSIIAGSPLRWRIAALGAVGTAAWVVIAQYLRS